MSKALKDPGLGQKIDRVAGRAINKDGSFSVKRINFGYNFKNTYQAMIRMNWVVFFLIVMAFILGSNLIFAGLYFMAGKAELSGLFSHSPFDHFLQCVYFSFQSFTTVGFGSIAPVGHYTSIVSSIEAAFGLISFAFITGLLYGRFSRPNARFQYSKNALIAPFDGGWSFQFRFANGRSSQIIELEANVILSYTKMVGDSYEREFLRLDMEREKILFLPLNWTLVHRITADSPLYQMKNADLENANAEIMILIKGFDDTFSQVVHSRYSYTWEEIVWGGKFVKTYYVTDKGETVLDRNKIDEYEPVSMEQT